MAPNHDPNKPNRGYFKQARMSKPPPRLPPGYDWDEQIEKYSSRDLVSKIKSEPPALSWGPHISTSALHLPNGVGEDRLYRTDFGIDLPDHPSRHPTNNFNRLSGVFCHRGFYDQAMKIPENSLSAIEYGLRQYKFHLHELDVKLHVNADKSLSLRKAFLTHDTTGVRTTADCERWSQNDGRDVINTNLVTRGINLETNDYASTHQETQARLLGLDKLLYGCDNFYMEVSKNGSVPDLNRNYTYTGSTFQLDVSEPGDSFAMMLAWFRYHKFINLQLLIKGYNRSYRDGPALLEAVNKSTSLRSGALLDSFPAHSEAATSVATSIPAKVDASLVPKRIVTSSKDKTIRIWDYNTSTLERTLVGHGGAVNSVAYINRPRRVVSGSDDKTVRIWDADTGNLIHELKGHKGAIRAVAIEDSLTEPLVASTSYDQIVLLWNLYSGKLLHTLRGHKGNAISVAFVSISGQRCVVSGSSDGTALIWDTNKGKLLRTLNGRGGVMSLAVKGEYIATGSLDGTIRLWNTRTGDLTRSVSCRRQPVQSLAAIDGGFLAATNQHIWTWNPNAGTLIQRFQIDTAIITSIAVGEDRGMQTITAALNNGEVQVWAHKFLEDSRKDLDKGSVTEQNLTMGAVMVFYPQPILDVALRARGQTLETTTPKTRLELLDYQHLKSTTMEHIKSFIDNPIPEYGSTILEIVHSGLGLGYDKIRKTAVNPKDGTSITNLEVLLNSRIDRAMIEVSVELRKLYPQSVFSSCTRLSDIYFRDSDEEFMADVMTGSLKPKLKGEAGIPAQLRAIHGGLYPQSDIVVADDPLAEIAARTWIDEYAGMDRSQLMNMTYDEWIAQEPEVKKVVDELNVKFWPNTVGKAGGTPRQLDHRFPPVDDRGYVPSVQGLVQGSSQGNSQGNPQGNAQGRVQGGAPGRVQGQVGGSNVKAQGGSKAVQEEAAEKKKRWWK